MLTYVPNMIHICPNKRCLDVFGGEIRERRERICLGNYPKSFFFFFYKMRGLGTFMDFGMLPKAWRTLYVC